EQQQRDQTEEAQPTRGEATETYARDPVLARIDDGGNEEKSQEYQLENTAESRQPFRFAQRQYRRQHCDPDEGEFEYIIGDRTGLDGSDIRRPSGHSQKGH